MKRNSHCTLNAMFFTSFICHGMEPPNTLAGKFAALLKPKSSTQQPRATRPTQPSTKTHPQKMGWFYLGGK